jgi:hypothetical protein
LHVEVTTIVSGVSVVVWGYCCMSDIIVCRILLYGSVRT